MPKCARKTEIYSRVVGYFRPVRDFNGKPIWNSGKLAEWDDRKHYKVPVAGLNYPQTAFIVPVVQEERADGSSTEFSMGLVDGAVAD